MVLLYHHRQSQTCHRLRRRHRQSQTCHQILLLYQQFQTNHCAHRHHRLKHSFQRHLHHLEVLLFLIGTLLEFWYNGALHLL